MSYAHTKIAQIAAIDRNRCMGINNQLPWHLPEDLAHFKSMTTDETDAYVDSGIKGIVVMGRKTFESMGKRPLPKRENFILTGNLAYEETLADTLNAAQQARTHVVHNLDDALTQAVNLAHGLKFDTVWVIGGEKLFANTLMYTDRIELTLVDTEVQNGDAFYPKLPDLFEQTQSSDSKHDAAADLSYRFVTYERKSS